MQFLHYVHLFLLFLSIFNLIRNVLIFLIAWFGEGKYRLSTTDVVLLGASFAYVLATIFA